MTERVAVAGVGMVPFATPSKADSYDVLAEHAVRAALADAGLDLAAVQQAYAGYVYGDSTSGQNALYRVGMTGIPVINVNNNCSTGSSALYLARQAVASGAADCVLAMFHDQGLPVLKYATFGEGINVTLGLPIIRTSVDHGTALDLAGTGRADAGSLIAAIDTAVSMAQHRRAG